MNNLQIHKPAFSLQPTTFQEAKEYAEILAKSTFVPKPYQGKAGDILAAVQYGAEVGLKPLQSLQNVAVINGRPSIYGDAALALVTAHPSCISVEEILDKEKLIATCIAKRHGKPDVIRTFSKENAITAKLWDQKDNWKFYPERMLQCRARGFALRDQFSDVLLGLILAEEAQDYEVIDVTPVRKEKDVKSETVVEPISIHSPATTYRFAELNGTFTNHMTAEETLQYFVKKIQSLNSEEDLKDYEKFRSMNDKLVKNFYSENKKEAAGLSDTLASQKDFIKRMKEESQKEEGQNEQRIDNI